MKRETDIGLIGNTPIGKPMSNVRLYIIGEGENLQPIGVPGELCIGEQVLDGVI